MVFAENATTKAERFTKATADAIGKSERAIQAAAARGEALGDDLLDIAGTSLDKGIELDALVSMPEPGGDTNFSVSGIFCSQPNSPRLSAVCTRCTRAWV